MANATEMPSFKMLCTNNNEFTGGAAHVAATCSGRGGSALCQVRQLASKWQRLATQLRAQWAAEAMGVGNSGLIEMQFLSRVMVPLS